MQEKFYVAVLTAATSYFGAHFGGLGLMLTVAT